MSYPFKYTLAEENVNVRTGSSADHLDHKASLKAHRIWTALTYGHNDFESQAPLSSPFIHPSTYDSTFLSPTSYCGYAGAVPNTPAPLSPASTGYYTPSSDSSRDFSPFSPVVSPAVSSPGSGLESSNVDFSGGNGPVSVYNSLTSGGPPQGFVMDFPSYSMTQSMDEMSLGSFYSSNDRAEFSQRQQLVPTELLPPAEIRSSNQLPHSRNAVPRLQVGTSASLNATLQRRTVSPKARLFYCKVPGCGRDFTRKKNLTNHMHSHYGIKPFNCPVCNQSFTTKHTMTRHKKAKHPLQPMV
jgi:uncharacterized Zn-finger protein